MTDIEKRIKDEATDNSYGTYNVQTSQARLVFPTAILYFSAPENSGK